MGIEAVTMNSWIPGVPAESEVINHGDIFDLGPGIAPQRAGNPDMHNFHACSLRGHLDVARLRRAVDDLQARHPRMRARFYENPWTQYNYLLTTHEQIPLDVRTGTYATINLDLERELLMPIDSLKGPFCRVAYVRHEVEGTGLLIFHQNHGVGDGRCCEIVLSQLLKLYDGQDVPHFRNVKSLYQMAKVRQDRLTKFHCIEAQMPRHCPNAITDTFVDPMHPSFAAKFEGVCIEILRFDADDTQQLLRACRSHQSTVTSAVGAAAMYAVTAELLKRKRTTEFVTIGMTMNERGRRLGPEFDEECGNLVGDMHINCRFKPDFWETAAEVARLYGQVLSSDCTYEATLAGTGLMQHREQALLFRKASPSHMVALTGGLEHVNMASFGVLKRFGRYEGFEVLENFTNSHGLFMGCKVNLCTSGASGRLTACVMVTRNVVPHARELACSLRDHLEETLRGVIAQTGSSDHMRAHQWCREVAAAMDDSIMKRRAELALAPRSNDGVILQGDTSGSYSAQTHVKLTCNVLFTLIAGGGLSGFPIYEPQLKAVGVFNHVCAPGQRTCDAQDVALSDMFQLCTFLTFMASIFVGYLYDILGAQKGAVIGGLLASCSMLVIAFALGLDAQSFPQTQAALLYSAYILGDAGDLLACCSLLGWLWHYPKRQSFLIGLQNAAYQGSSMFGILFVWMVDVGLPLRYGFLVIALTNLLSAVGFYYCTPPQAEYFEQAGKVLNRHAAGMDRAVFAGCTHLKLQLKSIWGVMKLFPTENLLFWSLFPLQATFFFQWLGSFAQEYEEWFGKDGAQRLVAFYTAVYSPMGILLNPVAGLLMDVIGFVPYQFMCFCIGVAINVSSTMQSIPAQKMFIIMLSCGMATSQNLQQKWCVVFGPPDLFGTWMGASGCWMGFGAILLDSAFGNGSTVPLYRFGSVLSFICIVVLAKRGLPRECPKNMYDSPEYLRGHGRIE